MSSDPELNEIWSDSVLTATDMIAPGPLSTDAEARALGVVARLGERLRGGPA